MPTSSPFPEVAIPAVDLWGLMFEQPKAFPRDQVIYRAVDGTRHYTWADVQDAASALGGGLRHLWGWHKGDVVAIYAPNDVDFGPIVYGVFHAGGVVSPANPAYSADELSFQLQDAGARAIVTSLSCLPTALEAAQRSGVPQDRVLLLGDDRDLSHRVRHWTDIRRATGAVRDRRRMMHPDTDLAFLVYSSGTTGLPKGVMLSHGNIVADVLMIHGAVGQWYASATDKILGVLPFFHIYGLTGLVHQPLHRGIELVVMPSFDLDVFLAAIQRYRITFVYVAPPVLVRLARDPRVDRYDVGSLKMITSGAAPLTRELVDAVHQRLNVRINQAYGLSETSPMTHTQPWDEWYASVGSVGKMFPNMRAQVMSPDGDELGPGQPGELWLAGPNVFKGYWKNERATRAALTPDGYFKTGDVGFHDRHHNFYITDRVKELIKYKGFQVAPAELEGKLMAHPNVHDVAVIGVYDDAQHTELPRAYVVANEDRRLAHDADEIVRWLAARVASYKRLRGGVRFVPEIPKSAAGKILRRVLKDRAHAEPEASQPTPGPKL